MQNLFFFYTSGCAIVSSGWATLGGRFLVKFMSVMQSVCWSAALSSASEKLLKIITQKPRRNLTRCSLENHTNKISCALACESSNYAYSSPALYCCMQSAHLKYCSLKCSCEQQCNDINASPKHLSPVKLFQPNSSNYYKQAIYS